jgi:hypothetical protein
MFQPREKPQCKFLRSTEMLIKTVQKEVQDALSGKPTAHFGRASNVTRRIVRECQIAKKDFVAVIKDGSSCRHAGIERGRLTHTWLAQQDKPWSGEKIRVWPGTRVEEPAVLSFWIGEIAFKFESNRRSTRDPETFPCELLVLTAHDSFPVQLARRR